MSRRSVLVVVIGDLRLEPTLNERHATLDRDAQIASVVSSMKAFAETNPALRTLVFESAPPGFHDWGVIAAWNLVHHEFDWPVLWSGSPEGKAALATETVAYGSWNPQSNQLAILLRAPGDSAH